jgi:hypothetical protein
VDTDCHCPLYCDSRGLAVRPGMQPSCTFPRVGGFREDCRLSTIQQPEGYCVTSQDCPCPYLCRQPYELQGTWPACQLESPETYVLTPEWYTCTVVGDGDAPDAGS